jgi:hypothetical protein
MMKTHIQPFRRLRGAPLRLLGGLGLLTLAGSLASAAPVTPLLAGFSVNVVVDAPPPPPRAEVIVASPGPDYIWVNGYWGGEPGHYVWIAGHWDRPPHAHMRWVAPHWDRDHDGHYHMARGEWR